MESYDHEKIELKWQSHWQSSRAFSTERLGDSEKYYVLEMFPYPSGKIHMGHVRNYSIGDVIARFFMMKGKNVLHPMGWDSFGLPAENAAIQNRTHPARWTNENIDYMRSQLKRMGLSYDWEREIATSTPEYYRWNQWLFLKFLEKGLAYKKSSSVNWCPSCSTVLANEQVEEGLCWRCESMVEAKELDQWFFKTTEYAEELLDSTDKLAGWPERVLVMQRNWIGRSRGARVSFKVKDTDESLEVFTTRPDTLYGVTFMSLAPEHPLVDKLTTKERAAEVRGFVERIKGADRSRIEEPEFEKEGVFTGSYCINPLNGTEVPVYVANFVLIEYGTGAVMAVPAHDQRDFEFAKKYELPIKVVITPKGEELRGETMTEAYTSDGVLTASERFDGMGNREAIEEITSYLEELGLGEGAITYRLRDWGISRQRYWGCPIPVVYCDECGTVAVSYDELPVILPEAVSLTGTGRSPLASSAFVDTTCPKCGGAARRETDTMDTFVDSSWYFLRYVSPREEKTPFDRSEASYWMPVDQYIGGIEHAVMHLLYARFFTKAMRDIGLLDEDVGEPFERLLTQGMVCKETMRCTEHGYLSPEESEGGVCAHCGTKAKPGAVEKMSKSKRNTVDPDGIIKTYGADTTRLFSLFAAPPERDLDWSVEGVEGAYRFIGRVWRLVTDNIDALKNVEAYRGGKPLTGEIDEIYRTTHKTIKKVTTDIEERFHFNTAISSIMELTNRLYLVEWERVNDPLGRGVLRRAIESLILLLSPFAPHLSEELWQRLGCSEPVYKTPWPIVDEAALTTDEVELVVQVNGKVRSKVKVPVGSDNASVEAVVINDEKVREWVGDKDIVKVICVPDKLVNVVVK